MYLFIYLSVNSLVLCCECICLSSRLAGTDWKSRRQPKISNPNKIKVPSPQPCWHSVHSCCTVCSSLAAPWWGPGVRAPWARARWEATWWGRHRGAWGAGQGDRCSCSSPRSTPCNSRCSFSRSVLCVIPQSTDCGYGCLCMCWRTADAVSAGQCCVWSLKVLTVGMGVCVCVEEQQMQFQQVSAVVWSLKGLTVGMGVCVSVEEQ